MEVCVCVGGSGGGDGGGSAPELSEPSPADDEDDDGGAEDCGGAELSSGLSNRTSAEASPSTDGTLGSDDFEGSTGCFVLFTHLGKRSGCVGGKSVTVDVLKRRLELNTRRDGPASERIR